MEESQSRVLAPVLSLIQGSYFLVTGIWPLVSARTFELVTGPKIDFWLVKLVGVLISLIGGILVWAGIKRRTTPEVAAMAVGSAAALGGADVIYVAKGRIRWVYLLDALVELVFLLGWGLLARQKREMR